MADPASALHARSILPRSAKPAARKASKDGFVVPMSARTDESLRAFAGRLRDFLASAIAAKRRVAIADVAHTLQVGRAPMACRVALCASSIEDLRRQLDRWLEDGALERPDTANGALASAWAGGEEIDWSAHPAAAVGARISLPTYAFAEERHWIDATDQSAADGAGQGRLHPLLHANVSDLSCQRYRSAFAGEEWFLACEGQGGAKALRRAHGVEVVGERGGGQHAVVVDPLHLAVHPREVHGPHHPAVVQGGPVAVLHVAEGHVVVVVAHDAGDRTARTDHAEGRLRDARRHRYLPA